MEINLTVLKEAILSAIKITSLVAFLNGSGMLFLYCVRIRYLPVDLASLPGISAAIFALSVSFLFLLFVPSVGTFFLVSTAAVSQLFKNPWRAFWSGIFVTILQLLMGCTVGYAILSVNPPTSAEGWNREAALVCLISAVLVTLIPIYWPKVRRDFDKTFRSWLKEIRKLRETQLDGSRKQLKRLKQFGIVFGISSFGGLLPLLSLMLISFRDVAYKMFPESKTILVTDIWQFALILAVPLLASNLAVIFAATRGKTSSLDRTLSLLLLGTVYLIGIMFIIQFQFHSAFLAFIGIGDLRGCRLVVREEAVPVLRSAGYEVETLPCARLAEVSNVHILLALGSDYLIATRSLDTPHKGDVSEDLPAYTVTLPRPLVVSVFR